MFDDFTTQVQSDEFASEYEEQQRILMQIAEEEEVQACAREYEEWSRKAFPNPSDTDLIEMECEYREGKV